MAPTLLVDLNCYKPDEELKVDRDHWDMYTLQQGILNEEDIAFTERVHDKSGLGRYATYLPRAIHPVLAEGKPRTDLDAAMVECQTVMCGALDGLLKKTGISAQSIDILVTVCSIYCPTPSMASMLVNRFNMRPDIQSYHLGGMGCSNGVVAINLIRDLLKSRPNANAVLVTTEVTTPAYYPGKDRTMMVSNILFRMGAAAVLMSNNEAKWAGRAKYKLHAAVRVHLGSQDAAYSCIKYRPDAEGINGIYLGKEVTSEASKGLTMAMRAVGLRVVTWWQLALLVLDWAMHKAGLAGKGNRYTPAFTEGVQHFLIHAGGPKVLQGIGSALKLNEQHLQPSNMVLHDYGNVSSSSTWYAMAFVESAGSGVQSGECIMQVGLGSGIKVGVNVWTALRSVHDSHEAWEHRVDDERRAQLELAANGLQGWGRHRLVHHLVFLVLLALLAYAMQALL